MSRPRREVNDAGEVYCKCCNRWVHLRDWSTRKLLGDGFDRIEDIWYAAEDGTEYGKPSAYCKRCTSAKASTNPRALQKHLERVANEMSNVREKQDLYAIEMTRKALEGTDPMQGTLW